METVYSQDIKDAANLMADDLVVVYVFQAISIKGSAINTAIFPDSWGRQGPARAMCMGISSIYFFFFPSNTSFRRS